MDATVKALESSEMLDEATLLEMGESKIVDEATLETLDGPRFGFNVLICWLINTGQLKDSEVIMAVKRKINHVSPVVRSLTLDLLETFDTYCNMVFSEMVSEMLLEDLTWLIHNPQSRHQDKKKALRVIETWANSGNPDYLALSRQSYMTCVGRDEPARNSGPGLYLDSTLSFYTQKDPLVPLPERSPILEAGLHPRNEDYAAFSPNYLPTSDEEKKGRLVAARNSLELLSSILNSEQEPKPLKEDSTLSLLNDCKLSLGYIKRIVESTTNDEVTVFEALYLNDELQQLISKYEDLDVAQMYSAKHDAGADQNLNELPQ
ncbi:TOM1-like protein 2 [Lotus japonicus]|uniref:TOM1-like protein 2 n=1 Tax=Lotus japonicus TaxID=34305 RepID=UPI002585193D|nr:TOM1-like protein 2 [Lotus japonicus]